MLSRRRPKGGRSGSEHVLRTAQRKCQSRMKVQASMRSSRIIFSRHFTRPSQVEPDAAWPSPENSCAARGAIWCIVRRDKERCSLLRCYGTNMPISTVLVAEDEQVARSSLTELLEAEGFRVLSAEEGEQALSITLREEPDAVLLAIRMPGLDGLSVLRQALK